MTKKPEDNADSKQDEALRVRIDEDAAALGDDIPMVHGSVDRLLAQTLVIAGLVEADLDPMRAEGLDVATDAPKYLRTLREVILETKGKTGVERSEIEEITTAQQAAIGKVRAAKEQIVLLARVSPKVDHRALNVNLGGTIAQTLSRVPTFLGLVRQNLSKFASSERLPSLVKQVEHGVATLAELETNQEMKKRKAPAATRDLRRLSGLLFETLSVLSWTGQYFHYADPVQRDAYRLTLLRAPGQTIDSAPGDDEAVAPTPSGPRPVGESVPTPPATGGGTTAPRPA